MPWDDDRIWMWVSRFMTLYQQPIEVVFSVFVVLLIVGGLVGLIWLRK